MIEFLTVRELFSNPDLIDEAQMMAMDYCSNKTDPSLIGDPRFEDDCIIVIFYESGNRLNTSCMPIEDFYETYIDGGND